MLQQHMVIIEMGCNFKKKKKTGEESGIKLKRCAMQTESKVISLS